LAAIRPLVKQPVEGFRAPSFSITRAQQWAFAIMARHGIRYDSSVFPYGGHPDYGIADAPRAIHEIEPGVLEFPMACATVGGRRVPVGGGGYFRIYPYALTRRLLRRQNAEGLPFSFYLHPWEVDPGQPRVDTGSRTRALRHYHGLARTEGKLERLLSDFSFSTMADVLGIEPASDELRRHAG
jgi:polysaccharide deacetylase family protein (PEP-CTERM system associated)